MVKLSVIVPVYKSEKYLRRCLDSIQKQTYGEFVCILVDDGSPDNCPTICDEYAKKDSRFRVIHNKNEGVYLARYTGLKSVETKYVCFVDSDDWIDFSMFESMIEKSEKYDLDCCFCNRRNIYNKDNLIKVPDFGLKDGLYTGKNLIKVFDSSVPDLQGHSFLGGGYLTNKMFKTKDVIEQYESNNIDVSLCEDMVIAHPLMLQSKRIYYIDTPLYNYFRNEDAITGKYKQIYLSDWNKNTSIFSKYKDCFSKATAFEELRFAYLIMETIDFILRSDLCYRLKRKYILEVCSDINVKELLKKIKNVEKNKYYRRMYLVLKYKVVTPFLLYKSIKRKIN